MLNNSIGPRYIKTKVMIPYVTNANNDCLSLIISFDFSDSFFVFERRICLKITKIMNGTVIINLQSLFGPLIAYSEYAAMIIIPEISIAIFNENSEYFFNDSLCFPAFSANEINSDFLFRNAKNKATKNIPKIIHGDNDVCNRIIPDNARRIKFMPIANTST